MRSPICLELSSRKTILASVHVRAHKQAGHMDASDLIKALQNSLRGGGRPHMERDVAAVAGDLRTDLDHFLALVSDQGSAVLGIASVRMKLPRL
jgi:hypothetical protein